MRITTSFSYIINIYILDLKKYLKMFSLRKLKEAFTCKTIHGNL